MLNQAELSLLPKKNLGEICKRRGLLSNGNKEDMVERILSDKMRTDNPDSNSRRGNLQLTPEKDESENSSVEDEDEHKDESRRVTSSTPKTKKHTKTETITVSTHNFGFKEVEDALEKFEGEPTDDIYRKVGRRI